MKSNYTESGFDAIDWIIYIKMAHFMLYEFYLN